MPPLNFKRSNIKACPICHDTFEQTATAQKYCKKKACRLTAQRERNRVLNECEPRSVAAMRICKAPGCTVRFSPHSEKHVYCGGKCQNKHNAKGKNLYADFCNVGKEAQQYDWGKLETKPNGNWTPESLEEIDRRIEIVDNLKMEKKYGALVRVG